MAPDAIAAGRPWWAYSWRLWLLFLFALLLVAPGNLANTDAAMTLHAARNLARHGDSGLRCTVDGGVGAEAAIADYIAAAEARGVPQYGRKAANGNRRHLWFPIGHQVLLVPCAVLGDLLDRVIPDVEARYRTLTGDQYLFGERVWAHVLAAALLPALFGAWSLVLLWLLALEFGCSVRAALACALAIGGGTQMIGTLREPLSDGPGLAFLLAALLVLVRAGTGRLPNTGAALGGAYAGAAVLVRYSHLLGVAVITAAMVATAFRQRRPALAVAFAIGAVPFAIALLVSNQTRFGSPFATGYPAAATWFTQSVVVGLVKLTVAGGKGVLWFSPLLWLLLPLAMRRQNAPRSGLVAWFAFLLPMVVFAATPGWQSGQCWGARYVTGGVVMLAAIVLPQARPWRTWPRTFAVLVAVGALVGITSLLATSRAHAEWAKAAVVGDAETALARSEIGNEDLAAVVADPADRYSFELEYSPLFWNWRAAAAAWTGADEVRPGVPALSAPSRWEDRGCRHLWFWFWPPLLASPWFFPWLPIALSLLVVMALRRRWSSGGQR